MTFVDEARRFFAERLPDLEIELKQYVPRILAKEGVSLQDARYARHLSQFLDSSEQQVLEDRKITALPRITVIGDAGSGKSFIVRKAYLESIRSFLSAADIPVPCFLDLGQQLIANRDITAALNHWYDSLFERAGNEYEPGCALFLDSLDEKLLREPNPIEFINALALFLGNHKSCLRNVVIACRRSLWNTAWFQGLSPAFEVFHADYLDLEDYIRILPDRGSRKDFFERAESLGIADLLGSPFIGFDLARSYERGEPLPSSRREWFEGQVGKLLKGQLRDRERDDVPPISHLLVLARQLACLATWSTDPSWTVTDAVDQLGEASISEQRFTRSSIEILFHRPLFTKTGDRFSFSHQLLREYLAAEALSSVSLRKQRQLLTSSMPGIGDRILTPRRGIAVALAEASTTFGDFLTDADPIVAFLADIPISTAEYDERLLEIVIDNAVASNRDYWWPIPPRGDRLDRAFHKHRPRDQASFLRSYLESSEQMARLWATKCATAWGGASELNDTLLALARDPEQHVTVRTNAIDAILASGHPEDIRQFYGLLSARDGEVRGHVLTAYRRIENPPPRDFIEKLCGGAGNDVFSSFVRAEWWEYIAQRLDTCAELDEAFRAVNELYNRLGNFRPLLLESLFRRALQLGFDDLPVTLIVKTWESHTTFRTHTYYHNLRKLLSTSRALFARIWHCALDMLGQDDRWISAWRSDELDKFAEACTGDIFGLLPPDAEALNFGQRKFVERMLAQCFHRDPSVSRLREFKRLAPAYTKHLRMPKSALVQTGRDRLAEAEKIAQALNQKGVTAAQRACLVISALGEILYGQKQISWLEPAEVIPFLRELRRVLLCRVVNAFYACITEITYSRVQSEEPNAFGSTPREWVYAVPFWILWNLGLHDRISAEKLDEFLRCYAFSGFHPSSNTSVYFPLLDRLQKESPQQWEECITWLIEFPPVSLWGPLEYLARKESDIYIDQCRQRLLHCEFATSEFNSLLDYWQALRPPDFEQVLCQYYECLEQGRDNEHAQSQQFRILWLLLSLDNDWAWEELERRVEAGTASTRASRPDVPGSEPLPRNPAHLSAIVKWLTCVRQAFPQIEDHPEDLGQRLLQTIVDIGGEEAVRELERLRREQPFSGAEWLSRSIAQIQDNLLMGSDDPWSPGQLLDFINQETMGIVRDERDLFEWVCQTVEEEKESLEHGEQVGGYWTGNKPQTEPICQNILWPALKRRLQHLGIVGVEEKYVGPNKVDFWVEKTTASNRQLQVFVELKVARKDYNRKELIDPLENQLWAEYLQPTGKRFGVYVVLWFKDESRYLYPTAWSTRQEFEQELLHRRALVAKEHQLFLDCYVVDMTVPIRRH